MPNDMTNLVQTIVMPRLYMQYLQGAVTSWMESNALGVEYRGGKYVRMHEMQVDGAGNYDRNLGFPRGVITGSKREYEMKMDRGREFLIDVLDNDETGFLVNAASVMAHFQQYHMIPEVDKYRFMAIYNWVDDEVPANIIDAPIAAEAVTDTLLDDLAEMRDVFPNTPFVITMSSLTQKYFGRDFERSLEYIQFARGALFSQVRSVDGNPFLIVPSDRFKTKFDFLDGISAGQEKGGAVAAADAEDITWMIMPMVAPIALAKIDNMRVFSPDVYQPAHAWKVDYRMFHDLWMLPDGIRATRIRTGTIA